jgi:hypothetical protein
VALGHLSNAAGRFVLYDYRESEGTYIHAVELRRELLAAAPVV